MPLNGSGMHAQHTLPSTLFRRWLLVVAGVLAATVAVSAFAQGAEAAPAQGPGAPTSDKVPCNAPMNVSFGSGTWLQCNLVGAIDGRIPVYAKPTPYAGVAPQVGAQAKMPRPVGWLYGTANQYFAYQIATKVKFVHPRGWANTWWARTKADTGQMGWVPEVFFKGGEDDERDAGLFVAKYA
jgi:hypothetical protein